MATDQRYKFVKSHYRSTWKGIIIDKLTRHGIGDLLLILVVEDKNGNRPRKRLIKILDESWVKPCAAVDIQNLNKDWLYINQFHPQVLHRGFFR